jgi:hypothetical protein
MKQASNFFFFFFIYYYYYYRVFLTLGSNAEFSEVLRELEREVSPLWPLRQCPRDFKKTSSERYFRSKGFLVDWCSFKLVPFNFFGHLIANT